MTSVKKQHALTYAKVLTHLPNILLVFTALDMDGVLPAGYINALVRSIIRLRAVGTHHLPLQWQRRERNE